MALRLKIAAVTACLAVLALTPPAHAAFPGKNGRIVLRGGDTIVGGGWIQIIDSDGSNLQTLALGGYNPHWSPDGKRLLVARGFGMTIANADGTGLSEVGPLGRNPNWSPDGRQIVFGAQDVFGAPDFTGIYVMNADGTDVRHVSDLRTWLDPQPAWSPDGTKIAFEAYGRDGTYALHVINVDGTGLRKLAVGTNPDWSPDSSKIAFTDESPPFGIGVINPDGSGFRHVNTNGFEPAWSPDGTKLVYAADDPAPNPDRSSADWDIVTSNADGSDPVTIFRGSTTQNTYETSPDWQPIPGPKRSDYQNAAKFCDAEQAFWGDQFASRYGGGANAYGKCVSQSH
jgi:Tol biopolymer transport system component